MTIFVTKDGQRIGPFNPDSLAEAFTRGEVAAGDLAWIEGKDAPLTVTQFLNPAPVQSAPPAAPSSVRSVAKPQPGAPTTGISSVPDRTLPRPPADLHEPLPESEGFVIERLRWIGVATPVVILLIMFIPWAKSYVFLGPAAINGYTLFSLMFFPTLLFAISVGGICLYAFEGALEGGLKHPLLALGCSFFAICTLAYLTGYVTNSNLTRHFEDGTLVLRGGWHLTMATVLLGTAGAVIPSNEYPMYATVTSWILTGLFAVASIYFALLGLRLGL